MFSGGEGTGKLPMALAFAAYIFCENRMDTDRCGRCPSCKKMNVLAHPDLHFSFPFILSIKIKTTESFQREFATSVRENPYLTLPEWEDAIDGGKKKSIISADESQEIIKSLSLKSFSGGYKIMIIWRADRLNPEAQNKLLKTLEEPEPKTLIILVVSNPEELLSTINSRTQLVKFTRLTDENVAASLSAKYGIESSAAVQIARIVDGDFAKAIRMATTETDDSPYFALFLAWMRSSVIGNPLVLKDTCTKITAYTREQQQHFLEFGLQFIHQSIMYNYVGKDAARFAEENISSGEKFAKYIVTHDLERVHEVLSSGHYMVHRNINPHLLFMKMGIDLMRLFNSPR